MTLFSNSRVPVFWTQYQETQRVRPSDLEISYRIFPRLLPDRYGWAGSFIALCWSSGSKRASVPVCN